MAERSPEKRIRILIVEDEAVLGLGLEEFLVEAGYIVVDIVDTAADAISKAGEVFPDLVLMDINLKGQRKGTDAAREIDQKYGLPVIFLSSSEDVDVIEAVKVSGSFSFLMKPVNMKELLANIELALQKHHLAKQLKDLNEIRNRLFSIISHDLRNPLAAIFRTTEILHQRLDSLSKEQLSFFLTQLHASAKGLMEFNDNLLHWALLQSDKFELQPDKALLHTIAEYTRDLQKINLVEKEIDLEIDIPPHLLVKADRQSLSIIFNNLVTNAIKYSKKQSTIRVKASLLDKVVVVHVVDEGVGIPKDKLSNVLHGLYRSAGTYNEKGTGLGISICKELIERNGGKFSIESEVGVGTTVGFTLPVYTGLK